LWDLPNWQVHQLVPHLAGIENVTDSGCDYNSANKKTAVEAAVFE